MNLSCTKFNFYLIKRVFTILILNIEILLSTKQILTMNQD